MPVTPADRLRHEKMHRRLGEQLPYDGRGLDHRALVMAEPIETGGDERLDRGRDAHVRRGGAAGAAAASPSSISIETSCSTKNGLPSAAAVTRARIAAVEPGLPEQPIHHLVGLISAQRLEHDPLLAQALSPGRLAPRAGRARRADDQRRDDEVGRGQMLDEIEQGRLAEWISSMTTTSGPRSESISTSR